MDVTVPPILTNIIEETTRPSALGYGVGRAAKSTAPTALQVRPGNVCCHSGMLYANMVVSRTLTSDYWDPDKRECRYIDADFKTGIDRWQFVSGPIPDSGSTDPNDYITLDMDKRLWICAC